MVTKFDATRAADYEQQSRTALAGYDACHELAACVLAAKMDPDAPARLLVVGAGGTGQEILTASRISARWRFTAVDPSAAMLAQAMVRVRNASLSSRTTAWEGRVEELPDESFDAATAVGVLHHIPGDADKQALLSAIAARLKPGAPLVLACNYTPYAANPLFLRAWKFRWRLQGATDDEAETRLATILDRADPPASEDAIARLLGDAGFGPATLFFKSLYWAAWVAERVVVAA